jgi:hypothetical protein
MDTDILADLKDLAEAAVEDHGTKNAWASRLIL